MTRTLARLSLAVLAAIATATAHPALAAEPAGGTLRGVVTDPSGAGVGQAQVAVSMAGAKHTVRTDARGAWSLPARPGTYVVVVTRTGFAPFTQSGVAVAEGAETTVDAHLEIAPVKETVNVDENAAALGLSADQSAGAIVIEGAQLDALPDDPDDLVEALQALAGASAGPSGGEVFVDGFTGGRIPPKSAIRMIRLNASPFSAEYDRPGFGRIEILTKPGGDAVRGQMSGRFNNDALNTKDPFANTKPDYQRLAWGGSVSGPLVKGKASYFVDFERRNVDNTQLVNATVLGPGYQPVPYNDTLVAPQTRTTVSPRLDLQLGRAQTITLRYSYTSTAQQGAGVGGFSLPSRASETTGGQHQLQLGDTIVMGKVVNETRFMWSRQTRGQDPVSLEPALQVQDAFTSGGSDAGASTSRQGRLELQNVTSWALGKHAFRAGLRLRGDDQWADSRQSWNGTVTFAGTFGPQLDASGNPVLDENGDLVIVPVTSIDRYRRTLFLGSLGLSPDAARQLGGGPSQLRIAGGDPYSSIRQWDLGVFVQDDWKPRTDLGFGLGLRYEAQTNVGTGFNLAPRVSVNWSPGYKGRGTAKTVVRGGLGVFYERVDDSLVLEARRFDGTTPLQYLVTNPEILDLVTFAPDGSVLSLPSFDQLSASEQHPVVRHLAPDLRAPVSLHGSLSVDRSLPGNFTVSAAWMHTSAWRSLRSRVTGSTTGTGVEYQYESTGHLRQDELVLGVNRRFDQRLSVSARYFLGLAKSDTDGAGSFPADSSDPGADWGRSSIDVRHRLMLMGSVTLPGDVRVSPFVVASTGGPFNITVGRDVNGDTVFTDRPSYASSTSEPGVVETPWGLFNPTPAPGEAIVPRNLGTSPGFFTVNLRVSKSIRLAAARTTATPASPGAPGDAPGGFPGGGPPGGGPPPGMGPGGGPRGPGGFGGPEGGWGGRGRGPTGPELTFSLYAQNLLDRTNPGAPVGNLSSPSFGESLASAGGFGRGPGGPGGVAAGNRSIELQVRASF